jgi:hypothetical protein
MADTRVNANLTPQIWDDQFSTEFFQSNPFSAYAGTSSNNVIRMKEDFASKRGNGITFEFITNLTRGTIYDRQPLRGHEDVLGEYGDKVFWRMRKKGISMHELDVDLAAINLRDASKTVLKTWSMEDVKWEVIDRLGDVGTNCDVPYDTSTAADRNAWVTANPDRVRFGNDSANYSTTFATAAANVDSTADLFTVDSVVDLKAVALAAKPRITPIEVKERSNQRFFVAFVHPRIMRDYKKSVRVTETQVSVKDRNEAIFMGGDREMDGVVIHEVDDMPVYTNIGAGGTTNVYPVYLCGQEALGWAIKQRYRSREQEDDYGQVEGIGMFGKWGMKKLCYSSSIGGTDTTVYGKQRGLVTGFYASSAL